MNWKDIFAALVVLGGWMVSTGCQTPPPPPQQACQADVIRSGDTVLVSFLEIPDALNDKEFGVRSDGTINMPRIGPVQAAGKKFGELERELRESYVPRYYRVMTVSIKPKDRSFSVGGEVKSPGRQVYSGDITVVRAITAAGDFTEFANRRKVEIIRADGAREMLDVNRARRESKYDRLICPGDHIHVPRSL